MIVEHYILDRVNFGDRIEDSTCVALGFDKKYLGPAQVTTWSVSFHTPSLHVLWLTDSLDSEVRSAASYLASSTGCSIEVVHVDFDALTAHEFITFSTISIASYARILVPYIEQEFVVYIDSDTIATTDLGIVSRRAKEMKRNVVALVMEDRFSAQERKQSLRMPNDAVYFNAGVLGINSAEWRRSITLDSIISTYNENKALIKYADQDLLNIVLSKQAVGRLPPNINILQLDHGRIGLKKFDGVGGLFHFNARPKPWELDGEPWSKRLFNRYKQLGHIKTQMPSAASFDVRFVVEAHLADGSEAEGLRILQLFFRQKHQQKSQETI